MVTAQTSQTPAISPLTIKERTGSISTAEIISVLKGETTGLHIRQAFSIEVAEEITANFARNPGLKERKDGVPGQYVGASHYRKDAATYFAEAENARPFVDALLAIWLIRSADYSTRSSASFTIRALNCGSPARTAGRLIYVALSVGLVRVCMLWSLTTTPLKSYVPGKIVSYRLWRTTLWQRSTSIPAWPSKAGICGSGAISRQSPTENRRAWRPKAIPIRQLISKPFLVATFSSMSGI